MLKLRKGGAMKEKVVKKIIQKRATGRRI